MSDFQALAGLESQVETAADTLAEVGSEVRSGAESVAEAGKQVRAGAENLADGISAAVADTLNEFVEQFRILVQTLIALLVLSLGGFLAGLLIGIRRGETSPVHSLSASAS